MITEDNTLKLTAGTMKAKLNNYKSLFFSDSGVVKMELDTGFGKDVMKSRDLLQKLVGKKCLYG